jgi:hypothetical protein
MPMHTPVIKKMAGMMLITISASFHWTAIATMKPEKKSDIPWTQVYSFSAMPWLMRLPSNLRRQHDNPRISIESLLVVT